MTSLYIRATPRQAKVLKIIEGAVRNADHVHGWNLPAKAPKSIAKRAAGTLTAAWPGVLAEAIRRPVRTDAADTHTPRAPNVAGDFSNRRQPQAAQVPSRLGHLQNVIQVMAGKARRAKRMERHRALVEVLDLMAKAP